MPYRITTVSRLDGRATTKSFRTEAQAREVWEHLTGTALNRRAYLYAGLFMQLHHATSLPHIVEQYVNVMAAPGRVVDQHGRQPGRIID